METQVTSLNQAIGQLRQDHEKQIASMQEFYSAEIDKIRQEYSQLSSTKRADVQLAPVEKVPSQATATELLSKLMN